MILFQDTGPDCAVPRFRHKWNEKWTRANNTRATFFFSRFPALLPLRFSLSAPIIRLWNDLLSTSFFDGKKPVTADVGGACQWVVCALSYMLLVEPGSLAVHGARQPARRVRIWGVSEKQDTTKNSHVHRRSWRVSAVCLLLLFHPFICSFHFILLT